MGELDLTVFCVLYIVFCIHKNGSCLIATMKKSFQTKTVSLFFKDVTCETEETSESEMDGFDDERNLFDDLFDL